MNTTTSAPQPPAVPEPPHQPGHSSRQPGHSSRRSGRRILRRLAWTAGYAAVRGAATTAGGAVVTAVIWWIHTR